MVAPRAAAGRHAEMRGRRVACWCVVGCALVNPVLYRHHTLAGHFRARVESPHDAIASGSVLALSVEGIYRLAISVWARRIRRDSDLVAGGCRIVHGRRLAHYRLANVQLEPPKKA